MQAGSLFKLAQSSVGPERSLLGHRTHLLDINGIVVEGQLQLEWTYSNNFHYSTTIESLAQDYACALRSLIAHCLSLCARSYTPDVSKTPTVHSEAQYIDSRQCEEDNATIPLHLLELPENISELLPDDIATAKAVKTQSARHPQWHLVNNQSAPVFCGFDFLTKTNIVQSY